MSGSVNRVVLVGRLTRDPELRKTQSGISYCRFTVACDRRKKSDGEDPGADFIGCVAWRQSADFLGSYGRKGVLVAVDGSIQTGSYTDRDGRKVYTTDVICENVQILERSSSSGSSSGSSYPNSGTSLRKDDIDANDGFDTGDTRADISDDDLPF